MSLRINTNTEAFNAHRNLVGTQTLLSKSMEKLSSGLRINRAADDAAGLAISEKMRAQIRGLAVAQRNALDGVSLVQTAEGALNEVHSIIQRVRELAVQYNNGTLSTADRTAISAEVSQLSAEVARVVTATQFNGTNVLVGSAPVTFQVGPNSGETIQLSGANMGGSFFDPVFAAFTGSTADIRLSTAPSPAWPTYAPPSAPPRTGSSTPSPTWPPTRRTCPPPSRESATPTSQPKWST